MKPARAAGCGRGAAARGGGVLGKGLLGIYLSVLVLLPVAALLAKSSTGGTAQFWREISNPEAVAAIKLTLIVSAIVVLVNAVFGTLIAWVLVRDEFPGKRIVNALIDLPFALPTIVAGVVLLALYGKGSPVGIDVAFTRASIALALLFVTLPFVVRSVQPVLIELDVSMEEAAESLGASPLDGAAPDRAAEPGPGDHLGRRTQLRARGRRVRLARADHGQPAVQDRGRLGLRVRADPERKPARRRGGVGRAAARGARRARRADAALALEVTSMSAAARARSPSPRARAGRAGRANGSARAARRRAGAQARRPHDRARLSRGAAARAAWR